MTARWAVRVGPDTQSLVAHHRRRALDESPSKSRYTGHRIQEHSHSAGSLEYAALLLTGCRVGVIAYTMDESTVDSCGISSTEP